MIRFFIVSWSLLLSALQAEADDQKAELEKTICLNVGVIQVERFRITQEHDIGELVGLQNNKTLEGAGIRLTAAEDDLKVAQNEYKKLFKSKYAEKKCESPHYLDQFYESVQSPEDIKSSFCRFTGNLQAAEQNLEYHARLIRNGGAVPQNSLYLAAQDYVYSKYIVQYFTQKYQKAFKKKPSVKKDCG